MFDGATDRLMMAEAAMQGGVGSSQEALIRLNLDGLRELAEIVRHRWDPIILALLSERPRRRRELSQQVRDQRGEHISDGVLSDALNRLQDEGLIIKEKSGANHAVYRATPAALGKVGRLQRISELAATNGGEATDR
jgi:DNA-binding HxlR family transcriptional regulator